MIAASTEYISINRVLLYIRSVPHLDRRLDSEYAHEDQVANVERVIQILIHGACLCVEDHIDGEGARDHGGEEGRGQHKRLFNAATRFKISRFQDFKISRFQDFKVSTQQLPHKPESQRIEEPKTTPSPV